MVNITRSGIGVDGLRKRFEEIAKKRVLVGIPAENASRDGEGINNAELLFALSHGVRKKSVRTEMDSLQTSTQSYSKALSLYLHEHGSPLMAVPARPLLEPAIEANKKDLAEALKKAYLSAASGSGNALNQLKKAGQMAENCVHDWFEDPRNNWAPNSPRTIAQKGSDHPMVDTSEMKKAIRYVIR